MNLCSVQKVKTQLRTIREDHNQTQREIATYLGISRQQYTRIESLHNDQEISLEQAIKLTKHYGCSLGYVAAMWPKSQEVPFTAIEILTLLNKINTSSKTWLETMVKITSVYAPNALEKFKKDNPDNVLPS